MNSLLAKKLYIKRTIRKVSAMTGIEIKKFEINLNTIATVISFFVIFGTMLTKFNDLGYDIRDTANKNVEQDRVLEAITDALKDLPDMTFKIAQNEKSFELLDARIGRITESYGNQFTAINSQMNTMLTQQALMTQTLQRIETAGKISLETPKELNPHSQSLTAR